MTTWKHHPPRREPPWLARHGIAILIIAGSFFLAAAAITIIDKALGQAAFDAVNSEPVKR